MEDRYIELLQAILKAGERDVIYLAVFLSENNIDAYEVIPEDGDVDFNLVMYKALVVKAESIKEEIQSILKDIDVNYNEDNLSMYCPGVYANFIDSGFDDAYEIWNALNREELVGEYVSDLADFLVTEEIVDSSVEELENKIKKDLV
ncbi:hypothetical protein MNB_SV-13-992 [hydrothermal vent metagenome]|uniref:Uncharacterized protein n=1 Tax=hydrothermal vent metagenome TaxID=652676 RepID=A0A1W1CI81_9ZZZZ